MTPEQLTSEAEQKDELLFVLHHRDAPTVVFLECNSYAKREELASFLRQNLTEYQCFDIDVTPFPVVSLLRVLTEHLPTDIVQSQPVQYVVNVFGLENSLLVSEDGQIKSSQLTAQLNLERELLFRNVPYIIIIWADHLFFQTLQRESPDLWSWVVYRFRFEGPEAVDPEKAPPLPPGRLPQRGNIAERQQRIAELETTYNRLNLDTSDKKRLLKDKITILKLLAEEYTEAFQYDEAQAAYESAIAIADRMQEDNLLRGQLRYELSDVLLVKRYFIESHIKLEEALSLSNEYQFGIVYQQIGRVYEEQQQWKLALDNYTEALKWYEHIDSTYLLGSLYHQIGRVYEQQRMWGQAIENYDKAIRWKEKSNNIQSLGNTYHQIGMVYGEQHQWAKALEFYKKALSHHEQNSDNYSLGSTYHQVGLAYAENRQWELALENYRQALNWKERSGNTYSLGTTYHQIGKVHEEQDECTEAINWYSLAASSLAAHNRNDIISVVKESINRVENKIAEKVS